MSKVNDCYAYLCVNHAHNIFPIQAPLDHFETLSKLQKGDWIKIKGLGDLKVVNVNVDGFTYNDKGKQGIYQEVAIACEQSYVADWKDELIAERMYDDDYEFI
jgi:hypothetical protein